jgi:hypothetical protein
MKQLAYRYCLQQLHRNVRNERLPKRSKLRHIGGMQPSTAPFRVGACTSQSSTTLRSASLVSYSGERWSLHYLLTALRVLSRMTCQLSPYLTVNTEQLAS